MQIAAQDAAGALHGAQVRAVIVVHRGGNRHDVKAGLPKPCLVGGKVHGAGCDHRVPHLPGGIHAAAIAGNFIGVQVEAHHLQLPGEGYCDGHSHVAQAHQGELLLPIQQAFIQIHSSNLTLSSRRALRPAGTAPPDSLRSQAACHIPAPSFAWRPGPWPPAGRG